ncbi:MAG: hypothetical protein J5592_11600 [Clostridia bacterium]|nr:hypothetical protein [Clostridia bacterium]
MTEFFATLAISFAVIAACFVGFAVCFAAWAIIFAVFTVYFAVFAVRYVFLAERFAILSVKFGQQALYLLFRQDFRRFAYRLRSPLPVCSACRVRAGILLGSDGILWSSRGF